MSRSGGHVTNEGDEDEDEDEDADDDVLSVHYNTWETALLKLSN